MALDYNQVNTDPNSPRYGKHYAVVGGTDSNGNPGYWHIYKKDKDNDEAREFVASVPAAATAAAPMPTSTVIAQVAQPTAPAPTPYYHTDTGLTTAGASGPVINNNQNTQPSLASTTGGTPAPAPTPYYHTDTGITTAGPSGPVINNNQSAQPSLASTTGGTPAPVSTVGTPAPVSPLPNLTGGTAAPTGGDTSTSSTGGTYTVVHGDTLSAIATRNGIPLSQLEKLNPQIKDFNVIKAGDQINLGGAAPIPTNSAFPQSSSYPPTDAQKPNHGNGELDIKHSGWGDSDNGPSADPAKTIMEAKEDHRNTNPLHIKHEDTVTAKPLH